jgi:hypothetical protein
MAARAMPARAPTQTKICVASECAPTPRRQGCPAVAGECARRSCRPSPRCRTGPAGRAESDCQRPRCPPGESRGGRLQRLRPPGAGRPARQGTAVRARRQVDGPPTGLGARRAPPPAPPPARRAAAGCPLRLSRGGRRGRAAVARAVEGGGGDIAESERAHARGVATGEREGWAEARRGLGRGERERDGWCEGGRDGGGEGWGERGRDGWCKRHREGGGEGRGEPVRAQGADLGERV